VLLVFFFGRVSAVVILFPSPRCAAKRRQGQLLIEFAFVALILYLLLAGIIEFGRALFAAQVLQQAADSAARELSRTSLPAAGMPLTGPMGALATTPGGQAIYSENYLVVTVAQLNGQALPDYFAQQNVPRLNQLLMPLMVFNSSQQLYQYPGQLVPDGTRPSGFTVQIPLVTYTAGTGVLSPSTDAIIAMIPIVEEITPQPSPNLFSPDPTWSPFNLLATNLPPTQQGLIALRINYPFQAATLSAYTTNASGQQSPVVTSESGDLGPYAGADGLGRLDALGKTVRPFRRVLSAQAIFRRELFQ